MKRFAVALVSAIATAAAGACAIGPGPVVSRGKAERPGQRPNQISSQTLMRPDRPRDPVDLVHRYLRAAADKSDTQSQTLLSYMEDKEEWKPAGEIIVYRVGEPQPQGQIGRIIPVLVPMQKVGTLRKDGRIEPAYADRVETVFNVVDGPEGYLLDDAPPELMLSDLMLQSDWYEPRPVYFWDKTGTRLITDIRYVPPYAFEAEKARLLAESLLAGPSPWLAQAVRPTAAQIKLRTTGFSGDGTISIDLHPNQLGEEELSRLATQLEKTLRGGQVTSVQLKIQGVPIRPGRVATADERKLAARFAVRQGKVVRLDSGSVRAAATLPLRPEVNTNVEWAAFSRNEESVAISRKVGNTQEFLIGPSHTPWPVAMPTRQPVDQAVWLEGGSQAALVLSNRTLYEVVPGENTKPTPLQGNLPGPVTSFSVVPDGRIALVIDNKLYMAALFRGPEGLTVTLPQQVPTAFDRVQHVALAKLNTLVIAGVAEQTLVLTQINLDGCLQQRAWKDYGESEQISRLVADYPNGAAFYDYRGGAQQLGPGGAAAVREAEVVPEPSAAASPSVSPAPASPPISAASFEG
jgi:Sporulation and spore germination